MFHDDGDEQIDPTVSIQPLSYRSCATLQSNNLKIMNSIPRYLHDFATVPKWEGEDSDDSTERDADSEGSYSDHDEKRQHALCVEIAPHIVNTCKTSWLPPW
ncbi:unnamed protein product [Haemonchus placei]|uniref:Uncharacterized protein n=1 Tax=Haemonchus placei TaxID=6290 RepID=A0A0N4W323_HAEPC|nr:unnamed protein product [Haemonchus placei]